MLIINMRISNDLDHEYEVQNCQKIDLLLGICWIFFFLNSMKIYDIKFNNLRFINSIKKYERFR